MISFYITLYDIGDSQFHHWALAATQEGASLTEPVKLYQVVSYTPGDEGQENERVVEDGYTAQHITVTLPDIPTFICAVRLPRLRYNTLQELDDFMATQQVGRRGSPLIDTTSGRWNCVQWLMRALKGLIDEGVVAPESDKSFFTPKAAAAQKYWGPMIAVAGTKCARAIQADRSAADMSLGVPVVTMESSGIVL